MNNTETGLTYEYWLKTVCFKKPTQEANDLAMDAWRYKQKEIDQLKAHVERLREIIEQAEEFNLHIPLHTEDEKVKHYVNMVAIWCNEVRSTPQQSLLSIKQEVIGKILGVAHDTKINTLVDGYIIDYESFIDAIRDISDSYNEK